jgi:hypothetical protein
MYFWMNSVLCVKYVGIRCQFVLFQSKRHFNHYSIHNIVPLAFTMPAPLFGTNRTGFRDIVCWVSLLKLINTSSLTGDQRAHATGGHWKGSYEYYVILNLALLDGSDSGR